MAARWEPRRTKKTYLALFKVWTGELDVHGLNAVRRCAEAGGRKEVYLLNADHENERIVQGSIVSITSIDEYQHKETFRTRKRIALCRTIYPTQLCLASAAAG